MIHGSRKIPLAHCRFPTGFTLIELLVVIFIIAILVTLAVGIGKYVYDEAGRKQTQATQAIVMQAIDVFYELTGDYPDDTAAGGGGDNSTEALVYRLRGEEFLATEAALKDRVQKRVRDKLLELPEDALVNNTIRDGFEEPMRYEAAGGLGGRPVLISKGPDGVLGNEDDIRSDER